MKKYQLRSNPSDGVRRTDGWVFIPKDPRNRDWQEYLKWRAAGNQPDPARRPQ